MPCMARELQAAQKGTGRKEERSCTFLYKGAVWVLGDPNWFKRRVICDPVGQDMGG